MRGGANRGRRDDWGTVNTRALVNTLGEVAPRTRSLPRHGERKAGRKPPAHRALHLAAHRAYPPPKKTLFYEGRANTAQSLIDDIINTVNDSLYSCNDSLETGMLSAPPAQLGFAPLSPDESEAAVAERARLEIEEGAQKLETLMVDAVDRNFDRLEIWTLRNVLCLPREEGFEGWVRLGHYEVSYVGVGVGMG